MLKVYTFSTFDVPVYIMQNIDGIDTPVLDHTDTFSCRFTELSTKDIKLLNGGSDTVNNTYKMHSNDNFNLEIGTRIIYAGGIYKIIKQYNPRDLLGNIAFTKLYIQKLDE